MENMDFFEGIQHLAEFSMNINNGQRRLNCAIWEEWQAIRQTPFTLRCNNKRELKVTHRTGFEQTSAESFESNLGGSLGLKGILSLESNLKSHLKEEIKFQVGNEVSDTFSFSSPECGYLLVRLYKKARTYHFTYEDTRFWHKRKIELPIVEWLEPIYDATIREDIEPNCNCKGNQAVREREGTPCTVIFPTFSKLAVFWKDTKQLEFADNPQSISSYFSEGDWSGAVPTRLLPNYLRFLTGTQWDGSLEAKVVSTPTSTTLDYYPTKIVNVELDEELQLGNEPMGSNELEQEIEKQKVQVKTH